MDDRFNWIIKFTLDAEGGYDNDPDDPGGETNFGIDKRSHPDVDIKNLTVGEATEIYRNEYWDKYKCWLYAAPLGEVYFDCCVNTGAKQANKFLQRAVGTTPDGVIGPKTLEAIANTDAYKTALEVINQRQKFYEYLAFNKANLKKFLKGWTNRNNNLIKYLAKNSS
jgi:lysozyme family protein